MEEVKNLPVGHRGRAVVRFLDDDGKISDRDLLELLLFSVIPRKDTKPIADDLLETFNGLGGVIFADQAELEKVNGMGKKAAAQIKLVRYIVERLQGDFTYERAYDYQSYHHVKQSAIAAIGDLDQEVFVALMLDKEFNVLSQLRFTDEKAICVNASSMDIVEEFSKSKPFYVLFAHNHPSGAAKPSPQDDLSTSKLCLLCSMHNVELMDHVVFCKEDSFSYKASGKLGEIKKFCDLNKIIKNVDKLELLDNLLEQETARRFGIKLDNKE